jgi:hypothetical protein
MTLIKRTVTRPWCDQHAHYLDEWPPASGWAGWDAPFGGGPCDHIGQEVLAGLKHIREEIFGASWPHERSEAVLWTPLFLAAGSDSARLAEPGDSQAEILPTGTRLGFVRDESMPSEGLRKLLWRVSDGAREGRGITVYPPDYGRGMVSDAVVDLAMAPIDIVLPRHATAQAAVKRLHALVTNALERRVTTFEIFVHEPKVPVST